MRPISIASPPAAPATVQFATLAHHLEEQIRGSTSPATVNRYRQAMQSGEEFPPLLVADVGGALVLVDGFHRRDAIEALGGDEARAEIVTCGSLKEARWLGFRANLRHGQPLKPKLLRPAFRALVEAALHKYADGRFKSYRELAGELPGVSYSTVRRWMEADFPEVFTAMGGAESGARGGLPEGGHVWGAEQDMVERALAFVAEARALMQGVAGKEARERVAREADSLLTDLTWDEEGGAGTDREGPTF